MEEQMKENLMQNQIQQFEEAKKKSYKDPNAMEEYLRTTEIGQKLQYMKQKNANIIETIDVNLLDEKYVKILGLDKLNVLSCFKRERDKMLNLEEKELVVLEKCLETYKNNGDKEGWREILSRLLNTIPNSKSLISDIKDTSKIDYNKMLNVLSNQDFINPQNEAEYENYEALKKQKCDYLMKKGSLEEKKLAICEAAFGHNLEFGKKIIQSYGSASTDFPDSQIRDYINAIKTILEEKNEANITKMYKQLPQQPIVQDNISIERQIKKGFESFYNEKLFKPDQGIKLNGNMYLAGADFNMLVHAVSGLSIDKNTGWTEKTWMRPDLNSRNICASYIRNDMMATAPISTICFGFSNIENGTLNGMSNTDMGSPTGGSLAANSSRNKFFTPNSLINETKNGEGYHYNEVDIERMQNGEKKEPDYILVFKRNGKISNMETAQKAQQSWISEKRPNGLPIVIADQDLCLYNELKQLKDLSTKFEQEPKQEIAKEIFYKIKNNRNYESSFASSIDYDFAEMTKNNENVNFMEFAQNVMQKNVEIEQELNFRFENCKDTVQMLENRNVSKMKEVPQENKTNESLTMKLNVPPVLLQRESQDKIWENRFKGWHAESKKQPKISIAQIMKFLKEKIQQKETINKEEKQETEER